MRLIDDSQGTALQALAGEQFDLIVHDAQMLDPQKPEVQLEALVHLLAPGGALVFHHAQPSEFESAWQHLQDCAPELGCLSCGTSGLAIRSETEALRGSLPNPAWEETQRLLAQATQHFAQGSLDEAERALDHVLIWQPNQAEALKALGHICMQTGRYEKSVGYFLKVIFQDPDDIEALLVMAGMYMQAGEPEQAWTFAEKAYRIAPQNELAAQMMQALAAFAGESV